MKLRHLLHHLFVVVSQLLIRRPRLLPFLFVGRLSPPSPAALPLPLALRHLGLHIFRWRGIRGNKLLHLICADEL